MSKDKMTGGKALWLTRAGKETTEVSPWAEKEYRSEQFEPIESDGGVALFRKRFCVNGLKSARIDATALGVFELYCNGKRVGRTDDGGRTVYDELKPGWTYYEKRVLYYTYDLAPYLKEGENIILAAVAPGWYSGKISRLKKGEASVAFLAALYLDTDKGNEAIYTDENWQSAFGGAVRASDIWDGEWYDASAPTFEALSSGDSGEDWAQAELTQKDIEITPHIGPTVTVREGMTRVPQSAEIYDGTVDNGSDYGKINVVRRFTGNTPFTLAKSEAAVIDLGQNMVGWPAFTVKGKKGTAIKVRFGEMLNDSGLISRGNDNPEGSIYSINYRKAKSKICYVLAGNPEGEAYHPNFTFFGFRYCEITATDDVEFTSFCAEVVGSATRETGKMVTSDAEVNRLISNVLWGQRGNYLSIPTDCPQRNERLGWTGDTQAFCGTAAYNADVSGFFHKWLQDARDSQLDDGEYPDIIPSLPYNRYGSAAWSDAGIIVPYVIWRSYADTEIICEHYESMEKFMDWLATTDGAGPKAVYGDWLAYEPTDRAYISAVYYALDARYMSVMSRAIGKEDRAEHYTALYDRLKGRFRSVYCDENGDLKEEFRTQTGYLLALRIGLLPEERIANAVAALKQKIVDNGYKLSTGFVGSCILCEVLAEFGENDLAYSLLLQTEDPSWLYSVRQGATTIWERWNSYTVANGFGDVSMNSFNHYAYGAVQEWMYRHVAGIESTESAPGFAHPLLQPKPDGRSGADLPQGQERLTYCKTEFDSPKGLIVSEWDTTDGFKYACTVPVAATLHLPVWSNASEYTVNGERKRVSDMPLTPDGKAMIIELGEGSYLFEQK